MSLAADPPPHSVTVRAPAKINLHLGVGGRRADGFHPLATVFQAVGLYDDVTATADYDWSVAVHADDALGDDLDDVPLDDSNIAVRAGQALLEHHGLEYAAALTIRKTIPVAGGMAGGSADAAAALVAVDRLYDLDTTDDDLLAIAARLGSDVPFALLGGTAIGEGRGELITPVTDAGSWWWAAVPADHGLSTPEVYRAFDRAAGEQPVPAPAVPEALLAALESGDVERLADTLDNDLAEPALGLRPSLAATMTDGTDSGALTALLSGSGPTVLLLCRDGDHAREVTAQMRERGHTRTLAVPAPVGGTHVVEYDGPTPGGGRPLGLV